MSIMDELSEQHKKIEELGKGFLISEDNNTLDAFKKALEKQILAYDKATEYIKNLKSKQPPKEAS